MNPEPLAQLLREHLKYRTLEYVAASAPKPEAFKRRVFDIVNGKSKTVSLRVADEISIVCGRPDWLAYLEG